MAKCFMCQTDYDSSNPDDIAGDGKCASCKEKSARIALKVDVDMAEKRKKEKVAQSALVELGIGNEGFGVDDMGRIIKPKPIEPINFRSLGISSSD